MVATSQEPQAPRSSTSYSGMAKSFGENGDKIKNDADSLRSDIANLANSVSKLATEKVSTAASDAQSMAKDKIGDMEAAIRKNPTQSALIAVGVGFLVGLVLTR